MKNFATTFSKVSSLFAVIFVLSSASASAQITITSSDFTTAFMQNASSINYRDTGAAGLQPLVTQTGANQTWDFSGLPFKLDTNGMSSTSSVVPYSSSLPEADSFPGATHVQISSDVDGNTYYDYCEINGTGFYEMGTSEVSGDSSFVSVMYSPPLQEFAFPLTYQTAWTSTSTANSDGYVITSEVDALVDGWGSFIIPGNTSTQALRLREKITTSSPPTILFGDTIVPGYHQVSYSYDWFDLSGYSASIDADSNQNATDANYSTPAAPNSVLQNNASVNYSLSVGANPVSSVTNVSFTIPDESEVRISLMDPVGRESLLLMNGMAHPGMNTLPLDPTNLVNGTYFLRIESAGYSNVQKMIVAH